MKNLIIITGTILLGAFIVNSLVLGGRSFPQEHCSDIMEEGTTAIMDAINFSGSQGGSGGM